MKTGMAAMLITVCAAGLGQTVAAETAALAPDTPWRVFLVCGQSERRGKGKDVTSYTPTPPADWARPEFDASGWGRCGADLFETVGGYGFAQPVATTLLCLRTGFGITDPSRVKDLSLTLEYRGGVVVYVNGQEVARKNVPQGPLTPETRADEYPPEAFVNAAGEALPASERPAADGRERSGGRDRKSIPLDRPGDKDRDRYEKRIRELTVAVPASVLRAGSNVLALAILHAPADKARTGGRTDWSTAGLCSVNLTSASGAGVVPYAEPLKGATLSNATPLDTIAVTPGKRQCGFLWGGVTVTPVALTRGNPFEPLQPIRTVAPRGGTCSGQVVVSAPGPLSGVKAAMGPLKHVNGKAALPAESVRVCYSTQEKGDMFCVALEPQPADGVPVQPVWVLVDVPRDQAPGWYTGTLTVTLGAQTTAVPVQVLVAGWTLTDPKSNASFVCLYQSPETLAQYYKVEPWSDKHFALIEKTMQSMALMGNDILLVPVILDNYLNHKTGLVRWVRKGAGYEPEFSALERYLDLQIKIFGKPKVVTLSIWKHDFGTRTWFRGMKSDVVKPCMVTKLDPQTGKMEPMQAPHFGEQGSEEFWKTMIEGVRRILKARGCDDRFLLLGEPFDSRPLQPVVDFFKKIEPEMRWQIYSHFDGGEPRPKDGKWIVHGGFELGLCIGPNGGGSSVPELTREYPKVSANEYLTVGAQRCSIHYTSSPLSYRVVMGSGGGIARIGLDFWPIMTDARGRRCSFYGCPPNEGWLWRGHVPAVTAPGPDGTVRTSQGQMLLEGLQETELMVVLLRAKAKGPPEVAARIEKWMAERGMAGLVGGSLPQAMISLDLPGSAARGYALAAELAGATGDGDWLKPPPAGGAK